MSPRDCIIDMEFIKKKRAVTADGEPDTDRDIRVRINVGGTVFETWRSTLVNIDSQAQKIYIGMVSIYYFHRYDF